MKNEKLRADIKRELNRPSSMKKLAELLNQCYVALGEQQSTGVVMPERKDDQGAPTVNLHIFREGWNACLDEFERLNGTAWELKK